MRVFSLHYPICQEDLTYVTLKTAKMKKKAAQKKVMIAFLVPVAWFSFCTLLVFALTAILLLQASNQIQRPVPKYSIYSSKPLVLGATSIALGGEDARAVLLDQFFEVYKCPMQNLGKVFVEEADKNDIPFWVVPAIAFQESTCGKRTPEINGYESYNAWGWAVYGNNVKTFSDWEHGIQVVSEYMSDRFFSQGVTDPCEIMRTYTPPSSGSWCEGIKFFRDRIVDFKTPI